MDSDLGRFQAPDSHITDQAAYFSHGKYEQGGGSGGGQDKEARNIEWEMRKGDCQGNGGRRGS